MPPMDTDRIPTQPTTGHEPPDVTSLTPGPSQAPTPAAAGRGSRTAAIGAVVLLAFVVTFTAGIGVGRLVSPVGSPDGTTPNPGSSLRPTDFSLIREADRATALQPGEQVDDAHRGEWVAGLGDGRRHDARVREARRRRPQRAQSDGRCGGVGHVRTHLRVIH